MDRNGRHFWMCLCVSSICFNIFFLYDGPQMTIFTMNQCIKILKAGWPHPHHLNYITHFHLNFSLSFRLLGFVVGIWTTNGYSIPNDKIFSRTPFTTYSTWDRMDKETPESHHAGTGLISFVVSWSGGWGNQEKIWRPFSRKKSKAFLWRKNKFLLFSLPPDHSIA